MKTPKDNPPEPELNWRHEWMGDLQRELHVSKDERRIERLDKAVRRLGPAVLADRIERDIPAAFEEADKKFGRAAALGLVRLRSKLIANLRRQD